MAGEITWLSVDLTTFCDRRCPNCSVGIGIHRKLQHHPWEYFEQVAPYIQGMKEIKITGGEPTIHPQFAEFVPRFKDLFGCEKLTLNTDGFRVPMYRELIEKHFDHVYFTHYETPVSERASAALAGIDVPLNTFMAGNNAVKFTPRSRRGAGGPCDRAGLASYSDGKFYGCCVAPGIEGSVGIEPSMDWKQQIGSVPLPCKDCLFSPA